MGLESLRELDRRDCDLFQAVCLVTDLAIEMRMKVGMVITPGDFIFLRPAPVFERMNEFLLSEQVESTEDTGFIDCL